VLGRVEVVVFAEGETEERFIKQVIAPALVHLQVYIKPVQLHTSQTAKGGAVTFDRLKLNARNTLRQRGDVVLTTFLDLYGLDTSFPAFGNAAKQPDVFRRVSVLENALQNAIVEAVGCRADRFLPHIQPYEFEGLLFSDVAALCGIEPTWAGSAPKLVEVRSAVPSPEHINDSFETKPSRRLESILKPSYRKTLHGPRAAQRISLEVIEQECAHFRSWMNRLRALAVST
jgi:hypothetical protein